MRVMRVTHVMRVISPTPIPRIIFVLSVVYVIRVMHIRLSPTFFSLIFFCVLCVLCMLYAL